MKAQRKLKVLPTPQGP